MPARSLSLAEGAGSGDIRGGRHGTIGPIPLPAPWLLVVSHPRPRGSASELQLLLPSRFSGIPCQPFHYPMGMPSMALTEMLYRSAEGMKRRCHGLSCFCSRRPWTGPVPGAGGEQQRSPAGTRRLQAGRSGQGSDSPAPSTQAPGNPAALSR